VPTAARRRGNRWIRGCLRKLLLILAAALLLGGCGGSGQADTYAATLPEGWRDATRQAESKSGTDFEAVYEGPHTAGITASIAILRVEAEPDATLEDIIRAGRANLGKAYGVAGPPVRTRLGGEPAMQLDYEAQGGRVRQVGALHGRFFYLLSFTAAPQAFERDVAALAELIRSWRWR